MYPQSQPTFIPPSPVPRGRKAPLPMLIGLIVGVLILVGVGLYFVLGSNGDSLDQQKQHLSARMDTLEKLISEGNISVKNANLRKAQADASLLIVGANAALRKEITAKPDKVIVAEEAETTMFKDLTDAKLNGNFDRPYQKALSTKLESTMALLKEIYNKSPSGKAKVAASSSYDTYQSVLAELSDISL